jgi:hypothetical protein
MKNVKLCIVLLPIECVLRGCMEMELLHFIHLIISILVSNYKCAWVYLIKSEL